jgi:hypothetical protein
VPSKTLKDAATAAFRDNAKRAEMTPEEREEAAQWYVQIAEQTVGTHAELARLYNLERAKFLRGEVLRIAPTARQYGEEIGYADETPV